MLQLSVFSIHQDRKGFLWLGTGEGLHRYDGYGFKVFAYDPSDTNSLNNNLVYSIDEDSQGILRVGTAKGLNRFDLLTEQLRFFHRETPTGH